MIRDLQIPVERMALSLKLLNYTVMFQILHWDIFLMIWNMLNLLLIKVRYLDFLDSFLALMMLLFWAVNFKKQISL